MASLEPASQALSRRACSATCLDCVMRAGGPHINPFFLADFVRPILAARDLFQGAVDKSGLTTDETVWKTVEKIAHRRHVKIQDVVVKLKMDKPEAWIHEFTEVPIGEEDACLDKTIDRVETDLEPLRHRANLWAVGDVDGLLASTFPDDRIACFNALFSVPRFHNQLAQAGGQLDNEWMSAADSALTHHESSFAVLPISQLLNPDGWLAKLRARGYSVQDPYGRDARQWCRHHLLGNFRLPADGTNGLPVRCDLHHSTPDCRIIEGRRLYFG